MLPGPEMDSRLPSWFERLGALLLVSALTACGQAEGHRLGGKIASTDAGVTDPDAAAVLRVGICGAGADVELIDDMEDNNQAIIPGSGRAGSWFAFNDESGTQFPPAKSSIFPMSAIAPARSGSRVAANTTGSNFRRWGAGIGFEFATTLAYDASRYQGVAFWARVAPGSSRDLRFNVTDRNTSQYGGVCDLDCQPSVGPVEPTEPTDGMCNVAAGPCYDDFGADIGSVLNEEWQHFTFRWSDLKAKNWSRKNLPALSVNAVFGLRFQANGPPVGGRPVSFDVWIDDVSLLCK